MGSPDRSQSRSVSPASLVVSAALLAIVAAGEYAWSGAQGVAEGHHVVIRMTDYAFTPKTVDWRVGEKVTVTLVNDSEAHPGKAHEWMVGRDPNTESTVFGPKVEEGFEDPFFKGVDIRIVGGHGLLMMAAGPATFSGVDKKTLMAPKAMSGMMMEEGPMAGFMPLLQAGGRVTFSFRVPDRPGKWTYGCFQQTGEHFLNGMRGSVIVHKG